MLEHTFLCGGNIYRIPGYMMPGLRRYLEEGIKPGDFLTAVIDNDLLLACKCADDANMANLPAYADYLYNHAPSAAWGSIDRRIAWIHRHAEARQAAKDGDPDRIEALREIVRRAS